MFGGVFFSHKNVMWSGVQIVIFLLAFDLFHAGCVDGSIFDPVSVSSSTENPPIPQYRFRYYVRDENTGDYKSQEEYRNGDSVTGSYMVGESNGDLRVVKYVADVTNGFKADVNVLPGGSPVKPTNIGLRKSADGYNNQRTGISAPPKQRKPIRGFNPIVVKSLSSFNPPTQQISSKSESGIVSTPSPLSYSYYRQSTDPIRNNSSDFTTPVITQKSVQVELTYKDDEVVEKTIEKVNVPEKKSIHNLSTESTSTTENKNFNLQSLTYLSTEIPTSKVPVTENPINRIALSSSTNGLYQLGNMDIPSSIIEILNQQKSDYKFPAVNAPTYVSESPSTIPSISSTPSTVEFTSHKPAESTEFIVQNQNKNPITTESDAYKKTNLPQRPMRLIGLSPIYMDHIQLQTISENLTSPSQVPILDQIVNMQYATPAPLISGPLMGSPGPFRNIPRYVSDFSDQPQQPNFSINPTSISANLPVINSLPISAPIITQADSKQEIKPAPPPPPPSASSPLCNDCLLPANYMSYPLLRFHNQAASTANNNQKPCVSENTPYWAPYKPGFAYILMPSQIIKNNL